MDDDTDIMRRLAATLTDKDSVRLEVMERVRSRYISSARDRELEKAVNYLIERTIWRATPGAPVSATVRPEARALVLIGNSGTGKTTALDWLFARHPAFPNFRQPGCILISVRVPDSCTLRTLGRLILAALGYPLEADRREYLVWEMVRRRLDTQQVRFIHLDEIQNITSTANALEAVRILIMLKTFLNNKRNPISLILSGLPEVAGFIQDDPQTRRRARFLQFQSLTSGDLEAAYGILIDFAAVAQLSVDPTAQSTLVPRLMHAAVYEMGTMIELIHESIDQALQSGAKTLTAAQFATVYAERTGSAASANPFVTPDWHNVDCAVVLDTDDLDQRPANSGKASNPKPEDPLKRHKHVKRGDW